MTQYVDHSYNSCLNFASYFSVTCKSVLKSTTVDNLEDTWKTYNDRTGHVELLSCRAMLKSDCGEQVGKEGW